MLKLTRDAPMVIIIKGTEKAKHPTYKWGVSSTGSDTTNVLNMIVALPLTLCNMRMAFGVISDNQI